MNKAMTIYTTNKMNAKRTVKTARTANFVNEAELVTPAAGNMNTAYVNLGGVMMAVAG